MSAVRLSYGGGDLSWVAQAACLGRWEEVDFFPDDSDTAANLRAINVCRGCPVIEACGAYAYATNQQEGVWAGMTGRDRRTKARRDRDSSARARRREA